MQAAEALRAGAAAVTFLTRIPLRYGRAPDATDVARGAVLFPVVGALVGAAAGGAAALAHPQLPALAAGAIAIGVELVLTGGLHADALADTADAAGAPTRERALEIMRDPRIGPFGAAALVVDLLARAAAIAALVAGGGGVLTALVVAGALGRAAPLPLAAGLPYARASGGPGSVLTGRVGWVSAIAALLLAVGAALALRGLDGLAATGAAVATAALLALLFRRWLGGVTGDTLGAATQLSGTVVLLTMVALA
jgi:adenosylcobinamide-GDP ribazoletransferase